MTHVNGQPTKWILLVVALCGLAGVIMTFELHQWLTGDHDRQTGSSTDNEAKGHAATTSNGTVATPPEQAATARTHDPWADRRIGGQQRQRLHGAPPSHRDHLARPFLLNKEERVHEKERTPSQGRTPNSTPRHDMRRGLVSLSLSGVSNGASRAALKRFFRSRRPALAACCTSFLFARNRHALQAEFGLNNDGEGRILTVLAITSKPHAPEFARCVRHSLRNRLVRNLQTVESTYLHCTCKVPSVRQFSSSKRKLAP